MRTIDDIEVGGQRVLLRSDLNVPLDKSGSGVITDDGRIRASLPVIRKLAGRGARVVVMAHLGRPAGADFLVMDRIADRFELKLNDQVVMITSDRYPQHWWQRSTTPLAGNKP